MKSILVLLVTALAAHQLGASGTANAWTTTSPQITVAVVGGTGNDGGRGVVVDGAGNTYITGSFSGAVDFDPGAGTTTLTSAGSADVYVLKLDSSGDFVWAKSVGGAGLDQGWRLAVDSSGNVHLAGIFLGTADFDPGAGTTNLTSVGPGTGSLFDVFALKLDSSGDFVWAKSVGSEGTDALRGLSLDSAGNVILSGFFDGTADFDPGAGTTNLTSTLESGGGYSEDGYVLKLDSSGDFVWAKSVGGSLRDEFRGVAVDNSGNVYVTGGFRGTVDFDPGAGTTNLTTPMTVPINQFETAVSSQDAFVLKLNSAGNFVWVKQLGGTADSDVGEALSVGSSGYVHTVGVFQGTVDFDPGAGTTNLTVNNGNQQAGGVDPYVWKLDTSGNFVWARAYGSPSADTVNAMSVDSSGNVYTTGYFQATADFDPGAGTTNLTPVGTIDAYVLKLSSTGDFAWARHIGGAGQEDGKGLAADGSGNVYAIGDFTSTVDFDPGAGTTNLTSAGSNDVFVLRLNASGEPSATTTTTTTTATITTTTTTVTTVAPITTVVPAVSTSVSAAPVTTQAPSGQTKIARVTTTTTGAERETRTTISSRSSTVSTPVTTITMPSTTTSIPEIADVASGEAAILVGGEPVETTVSRNDDRIVISAGQVSATISSVTVDGSRVSLDADGNVQLNEGDLFRFAMSGFTANSDIEVWLFSTPMLLGTVKSDSKGEASGELALPDGVTSGSHRAALVGTNVSGEDVSLTIGIVVGSASGGVSTTGKVLISIPIVLAVLFALAMPARRRRRLLTSV